MENQTVLGAEEMVTGYTLQGVVDGPDLLSIMLELIELIDMTVDGSPDARHYPNDRGCGGEGWQIYQPLTESWIVGGTWPALSPPRTRVVLSSCKSYEAKKAAIAKFLCSRIGPVIKYGTMEM